MTLTLIEKEIVKLNQEFQHVTFEARAIPNSLAFDVIARTGAKSFSFGLFPYPIEKDLKRIKHYLKKL